MNTLPTQSTLRDKPFAAFSGAQTNIHPPVADHPTLQKNWQNGIAKRALQHMKILGDSHRNTLPDPEALTGQWRLMLDGPQAPREQLVRPTVPKTKADKHSPHHTEPATANTAKKIPVSTQAMDKDSPGWIPETAEPGLPTVPTMRTTGNAGVSRKHGHPDVPNVEQRHQQQPLPAAPDSYHTRTPPMPAEPVLDGLIREAASGIPGIATDSLASATSAHGPLPANLPVPSEQIRPPAVLDKTLATQTDLGDLAERIKRILDDEARRHGIDV